jgi:hypothetical protein
VKLDLPRRLRSGRRIDATIESAEITSDPRRAGTNPSTWKARPSPPASHAVSISISALITKMKRPSVSAITPQESQTRSGRTSALTSPRMRATPSSVTISPSAWMPGTR